jgi:hypothetical protein
MVLTVSFALSPVTGLFCHRRSADRSCLSPVGPTRLRELDASVGASGPHDFAVRCNISRPHAVDRSQAFRQPALQPLRAQNAAASTASAPRVRDDRDTPLWWGGMRKVLDVIWGNWESEIFFGKSEIRLDTPVDKPPDGQITTTRRLEQIPLVSRTRCSVLPCQRVARMRAR